MEEAAPKREARQLSGWRVEGVRFEVLSEGVGSKI